jgi:hypothetical protein
VSDIDDLVAALEPVAAALVRLGVADLLERLLASPPAA